MKEALLFSYDLACEGTCLEGSTLVIEEVPLRIYCSTCRAEQSPVSLQCLRCSQCGALAGKVTPGADLELTALELET